MVDELLLRPVNGKSVLYLLYPHVWVISFCGYCEGYLWWVW